MYKVMLIDDDAPVLKYVRGLIPWERHGMEVCASTYSSVKALQLFNQFKPDLVITDIGIPQIDGIELASVFRKENPNVRIIFLTCHEDFQYARKALQINADDYLIKDELTADKLQAALDKALEKMTIQSKYLETTMIRNTINRNKVSLIQAFTEQLGSMSPGEIVDHASQIGIKWKYNDYKLAITTINYYTFMNHYRLKDIPLLKYGLYNIAEELCGQEGQFVPLLDKDFNLIIAYNFFNRLDTNPHQKLRVFLEELSNKAKSFLNIEISHYVTNWIFSIRELGNVQAQLKHQIDSYFYKPYQVYNTMERTDEPWNMAVEGSYLKSLEEEWKRVIKKGSPSAIEGFLQQLERNAREWGINPSKLKGAVLRWLQNTIDSPGPITKEFEHCFAQTSHISQTMALMKYACSSVRVTERSVSRNDPIEENPKINEIEQYIMNHLSENITSITMANYLHLNPSYFSRYFKRLSGETFTDYVHRLKMRVAVKLLAETDQTVEFISYSLGYSDRTYFSKIFSKYMGQSPTEYKHSRHEKNVREK
jgi:two-component system, response regulator YesN